MSKQAAVKETDEDKILHKMSLAEERRFMKEWTRVTSVLWKRIGKGLKDYGD